MDSELIGRQASETDETGATMRGVRFVIEYGPDTGLAVMPRAVNGRVPRQGCMRMFGDDRRGDCADAVGKRAGTSNGDKTG
jgi:hypothetical protein